MQLIFEINFFLDHRFFPIIALHFNSWQRYPYEFLHVLSPSELQADITSTGNV